MERIVYAAMDVHAKQTVLGCMDTKGRFKGNVQFQTSERNMIAAVKAIPASEKHMVIEESTLAQWTAQVVRPHVTKLVIADPRENALIYRHHNKKDEVDTQNLCRLLRLGELREVYHPANDDRAIFKASVQHYLDLCDQQVRIKLKIKAAYRHWGVLDLKGEKVYSPEGRKDFIAQVKHAAVCDQITRLYTMMDAAEQVQAEALGAARRLGRKYPEIEQFQKIPGIGPVGALVFDAFVQTPHRFADKRAVWRYCRLGIRDHSSDGTPLGYKRLDRSGVSELKNISYRAWMSAMKGDNVVKRFYLGSLKRTSDRIHARLNTQRKIIAVMYGIWRKGDIYRSELFSDSLN